MAGDLHTVSKSFQVRTENLVHLPKGYRKDRRYPLVVALHGMGMTAGELRDLLRPLYDLDAILFVPDGVYPFEIRTGEEMRIGRAWYLYTGDEEAFVESMERSGRHLESLLRTVRRDYAVDPGRIALLGFSQGGYFAGYHGIRHAKKLAALVVIGARVKDEVLDGYLKRARNLPILHLHGRKDRAVPLALARRSTEAIYEAGLPVELWTYAAGHSLNPQMLSDARGWLEKKLSL